MKLGVHAYAWCSQWSNDTLDIVDRVKRLGLDFVEIPLMRLDTFDGPAIRRRLRDAGLTAATSTVLFAHNDITNPDPEVRAKGVEYLKQCVMAASEIDAPFVSGVTYSQHVKPSPKPPTEVEWQYAADALREVARFAQGSGVQISLEPVNRYESYLVNTSEQAMRLREMVGDPNVKVHLDTYHMNIEEKDLYQATMLAADHLVHLHLSESDRGIPGTALVHWDDLFRALKEINYQGFAALESFADMTTNMNTWTWRQLAPDSDTLVLEGAQFVRDMMRKHGLE